MENQARNNILIPLIHRGNRNDVVQAILDAQRDDANGHIPLLHEINNSRESPLICAIKKGYTTIAQILIGIGADVNFRVEHSEETPIMYAARAGNESIVRLLIEAGANINDVNNQNLTASDIAIAYGHDDADPVGIQALLELAHGIQGLDLGNQPNDPIDDVGFMEEKDAMPPIGNDNEGNI